MATMVDIVDAMKRARKDGFELSESTVHVSEETYNRLRDNLDSSNNSDEEPVAVFNGPSVIKMEVDSDDERLVVGDVTYTL